MIVLYIIIIPFCLKIVGDSRGVDDIVMLVCDKYDIIMLVCDNAENDNDGDDDNDDDDKIGGDSSSILCCINW